MRRLVNFIALISSLGAGLSCCPETKAVVGPARYDVLAQALGHWEWDSTAYQAGMQTQTTKNFTRQLFFGSDSMLTVQRNNKLSYHTAYHLSRTLMPNCGGSLEPLQARVTFASDPDMPNSEGKGYGNRLGPASQTLKLTGVNQCIDAGGIEFYHWVDEPLSN
jgi:hypothetical protein